MFLQDSLIRLNQIFTMENRYLALRKFLKKAKRKTFASRVSIPKLNSDGSKEYRYSEGDFVYLDRYYGSLVDTGQEQVWHNQNLLWSMSYRGGMLCEEHLSRKCFSFLKKCLRTPPLEFPIRGPNEYEEGEFKYKNNYDGDITDFVGEEEIFFNGKKVYFRNYLGGIGKRK